MVLASQPGSSTKRRASRSPDTEPPAKRAAPSSPEEGELDDTEDSAHPPSTNSNSVSSSLPPPPPYLPAKPKTKVAFPFKKKADPQSNQSSTAVNSAALLSGSSSSSRPEEEKWKDGRDDRRNGNNHRGGSNWRERSRDRPGRERDRVSRRPYSRSNSRSRSRSNSRSPTRHRLPARSPPRHKHRDYDYDKERDYRSDDREWPRRDDRHDYRASRRVYDSYRPQYNHHRRKSASPERRFSPLSIKPGAVPYERPDVGPTPPQPPPRPSPKTPYERPDLGPTPPNHSPPPQRTPYERPMPPQPSQFISRSPRPSPEPSESTFLPPSPRSSQTTTQIYTDGAPPPPKSPPPPAPPPDPRVRPEGLPDRPALYIPLPAKPQHILGAGPSALQPPRAPPDYHSPASVHFEHNRDQSRASSREHDSYRKHPIPQPPPRIQLLKTRQHVVRKSREEEKAAYGRVFEGCGLKSDYEMTTKLGEGTFGEVHKAIQKATGKLVALKRILMHNEKEGMPVTALREIKILKALRHECIIDILDMFVVHSTEKEPMSVYMVFPYMDHDLAGLLENERVKLSPSQIKLYMKQLLEGTEYMHRNHILHRDMKAANLLISNDGSLRIADFGLARAYDAQECKAAPYMTFDGRERKERKYTNCVVTRWYRPPELLLGARNYGGEVDMWGIGCVFGEMFNRRPILPGNSDLDQLDKIWNLCGTPNQHTWPNYDKLPGFEGMQRFTTTASRRVKPTWESAGAETVAVDLLDKLLICNPLKRITASQALEHDYFWTDPMPADPKNLPSYESSHEFDKRSHRQMVQHRAAPPPGAVPPGPPGNLARHDSQPPFNPVDPNTRRSRLPPPRAGNNNFHDRGRGPPPQPVGPPIHLGYQPPPGSYPPHGPGVLPHRPAPYNNRHGGRDSNYDNRGPRHHHHHHGNNYPGRPDSHAHLPPRPQNPTGMSGGRGGGGGGYGGGRGGMGSSTTSTDMLNYGTS
ncbi:hypothetical protein GYMLUDRAFT_34719 [Collybiopsis luxurians FD-317 M1]|nr:hypothetical protein GYMLUDRAFT_34719 [Collybiopsis luxurians FD-317 M1]